MRNLILSLLLVVTMTGYSQGKVYDLDKEKDNSPTYTQTGDYAIYRSERLPVYMTKKGKLFIFVTSKKTGKPYRKYING